MSKSIILFYEDETPEEEKLAWRKRATKEDVEEDRQEKEQLRKEREEQLKNQKDCNCDKDKKDA